jgi:hypothetical protein
MRLGKRQLELLRGVGPGAAVVVPDNMTRRLCSLGLMKAHGGEDGSFAAVTPNGLRALADAADAGRISLFKMPDKKSK